MTGTKRVKLLTPLNMSKIAMLSAVAFVLTLDGIFRWRLPIFPSFLALDIADMPAVVGSMALGPFAGLWILVIRNILSVLITGSSTGGLGPIVNFITGATYILPLAFIYHRVKGIKGFMLGALAGTLISTAVALALNYFVMIPVFANLFFEGDVERIIGMGTAINENITNLFTLLAYSILPFNILKNVIVTIASFIMFKVLTPVFEALKRKGSSA
ncbi:MAG: ECF transporter S component [Defluviitaleaceae bacterium]|nr:ECF transporter S component [Defluviitaleaceae bacterium]